MPPHKFINIRLTFLQKDWSSTDYLNMIVNGKSVEIARVDPLASPGGVSCQNSMTYVEAIEYSFADALSTLNITFDGNLTAPAVYGINSLMIRYGNCHQTCGTCFGSGPNNCETCKSFLQFWNSACANCDAGFFAKDGACWKCHWTCSTCSGFGPANCLSCNENEATLSNNSCILLNTNTLVFAQEFADINFTSNENWTSSTGVADTKELSQCGMYTYFGGYQLGSPQTAMSKEYEHLPAHFAVRIQLSMILIDSLLTSFDYQLTVNGVIYNGTLQIEGTKTNECGQSLVDSYNVIKTERIPHKDSLLSLRFKPNISASSHYGIRGVVVRVIRCRDGCRNCDPANTSMCL